MVHPLRAAEKSLRRMKPFNLFWQSSISSSFPKFWKAYRKNNQALLALSYPPTFFLESNKKKIIEGKLRMEPNHPSDFALHGLFGSRWFHMRKRLRLKRQARRGTSVVQHAQSSRRATSVQHAQSSDQPIHLSRELCTRVASCMPHLKAYKAELQMIRETRKHEPEISFLDVAKYPEFTVDLFEKYKFNKLVSFVVEEISKDQTPVWEFSYYKAEWIGIRLGDLRRIAEKYPPISKVGKARKLTFRLMPSKLAQDQFFLYELHVGVTKNGRLTCGGPTSSVFEKVREIPTSNSIVLLLNRLQY